MKSPRQFTPRQFTPRLCHGLSLLLIGLTAATLVPRGVAQEKSERPKKSRHAGSENPEARTISAGALKELTDELIMLAISDELRRSEAVDGHRIDVDVDDGIVTLSGHVPNLLSKQVAVGLAERVRGAVAVLDEMEVNAERRDNALLKKDVRAALAADPSTHRLAIQVTADDNVVTLAGTVPTNGQKTLVEEVAMSVKGVIEVKNKVKVKMAGTLTDSELQSEISELYKFAVLLDDCQIEVAVKDGKVVLNGRVASSFQKSHADFLAYRAGAKDVDSRGINVQWRHTNPLLRAKRYEQATDEKIQDAVQRAFKHDPRLLSFEPRVFVKEGVVTLTGDVGHVTAQRAAEQDARHTIGVRRVKNNLRVRWPQKAPSDVEIAAFTRAAMGRDPYVERHNLRIECENAHVSLYGLVDTQFEKYHAEWIASRQKGVVHVNDYLAVRKKWKPKSDAAIEADLKDKLAYTFVGPDNRVTATVKNGVAILRGKVDTWYMWQTAMDQAIAAGAREPHNLIEVRYGLPSGPHYYGPLDYVPR